MFDNLEKLRKVLFRNMLETIQTAQTGHLGACCSSLELMLVLYFTDILRIDSENPKHPLRDYVTVRGHVGPLRYNIFHLLGWMTKEEMGQYRQFGTRLQGHEDMKVTPGVDMTPSGSLGMGLSYAVGACTAFKDLGMPNRVFSFLGDGEEEEGNISEAARHASHLKLNNLVCVIDKNGGQLSTRLPHTDSGSNLAKIWSGYGWQVITIENGHDLGSIYGAYQMALGLLKNGPVCIVANTIKGNGIPGAEEDYSGFHVLHGAEVQHTNETCRPIDIDSVLEKLRAEGDIEYIVPSKHLPEFTQNDSHTVAPIEIESRPASDMVVQYDTEEQWLRSLEQQVGDRLYVLTSDYPPRNFVYEDGKFKAGKAHYHNVGLREQHMTAMAHGIHCARKDAVIVILCGDAFIYRHMDQINVLAQAQTPVIMFSVQGGLSGAKNGSTHQSSGQPGSLLMIPGLACEEPCSAEQFIRSCNEALLRKGPTYIRMHKLPVRWSFDGQMENGYEVIKSSLSSRGTIITCGMIAGEAYEAVMHLEKEGLGFNLINITSLSNCKGISQKIITGIDPLILLYNGDPRTLEHIIGSDMVKHRKKAPSKVISHGFELGTTGSVSELMHHFRLDKESIIALCISLVRSPSFVVSTVSY